MKRLSSQLIITESAEILRNSIVQLTDAGITYHNILEGNHESAHTIFYNGIVSPPIISLAIRGINSAVIENYGYKIIPFDDLLKERIVENEKIIIDFGTEDMLIINNLLKKNALINFDGIHFIIACTVSPLLFLNNSDKPQVIRTLWSDANLIDKKITGQTSVSIV